METLQFFGKLGLILNIIGTIIVALSIGKNLADASQRDKKGREVYLASFLHPKLFMLGLVVIVVGFILQFIALG